MSNTKPEPKIFDTPFSDFTTSLLPLYLSPQVTVYIGTSPHAYTLPKALLCKQSHYFAATFSGPFKESTTQSTTLEEIPGVVSVRSFQLLVQWLCLGRVVFGEMKPGDEISAALEFVRLADMCGVVGMEDMIASHIKSIIAANPITTFSERNVNTSHLNPQHIISAACLPREHPVRKLFAIAAVEGYLCSGLFKFKSACEDAPGFSMDLLVAVKATMKTFHAVNLSRLETSIKFTDPFSGKEKSMR